MTTAGRITFAAPKSSLVWGGIVRANPQDAVDVIQRELVDRIVDDIDHRLLQDERRRWSESEQWAQWGE